MPTEVGRPAVATMPEVAEWLRIPLDKAYALAGAGRIPGAFRLGRSWRVYWATLEHALTSGELEIR